MLIKWPWNAEAALYGLGVVEVLLLAKLIRFLLVTKIVAFSCIPVVFVMTWHVLVINCAEACLRALYWTIDERQLCNVIFMDHIQDGSLLNAVNLRVLKLRLVNGLLLIESIGGNKLCSVVLWYPVESIERLWQTS